MQPARARVAPLVGAGALLPLLLCPFLLLFLLLAAGPASAGGPPEYVSGDIAVAAGAPVVWTNRTVVLTGNLTVETGARLTLVNSTLLFALPANGSFSVSVEPGGTFELTDGDASPTTAADRSSVASATPGRRYTLTFHAGSNVLVRGSEVRDFGYAPAVPGMLVQSSNVTFVGSSLGAYAFLKVEGASPRFEATAFEGGGQGSNYFYGSGATLLNCTFTAHLVAVAALQGSSLALEGALMRDLAFALAVNGSTVAASASSLVNSTQGLFLTNGSAVALTDFNLGGAPVVFGDNASELRVFRTFEALVLNQAADPVRGADVEFRDAGGTSVSSGLTGDAGRFGPIALLGYNETQGGQVLAANYTLRASRAANWTEASFSALTESPLITVFLTANLDPTVTLVRPAPGALLLAGFPASFEASVADPDATPGGLSVSWYDSVLGLLGAGAQVTISLPAGTRSLRVEVADTDNGFRSLSFVVEVVPATTQTFTDDGIPPTASFAVAMTPAGAFLLTRSTAAGLPALAVGPAWEVRPSTGTVVWSNGTLTVAYGAGDLPYGVDASSLVLARFDGTAWAQVPGSVHDAAAMAVRAEVTPSSGLGRFVVVATAAGPAPPEVDPVPHLIAVHLVPFSFPVVARDTPGQPLSYGLEGAPAWVQVDAGSGALTGTAPATERGIVRFNVTVTDDGGLVTRAGVELFVTSSAENTPPRLVNVVIVPALPRAGVRATVQVTYFDAEDDRPTVVELLVDGSPLLMEPLDPRDIYWLDGKTYVAYVSFSPGPHNLSFRTNDGAPGHPDVVLAGPPVEAVGDALESLNNAFLSLFVSVALTFAFIVWLAAARRDPEAGRRKPPPEPEDSVAFLEGPTLGRIEEQAPAHRGPPRSRQDDLAAKAEEEGARAEELAGEVDRELVGGSGP